ncbi:osiris 1 [Haematobia irritans]|uniref:osiris 1 n=1 Tax=Haematobia irritans TaxID=7368 RepID=UPI003F4F7029
MPLIKIISFQHILILISAGLLKETFAEAATNATLNNRPRDLLTDSDAYVLRNQKQCLESRTLVSCIKYKTSKIVWKLATNSLGYFPKEYGRELKEDNRRIRLIQLDKPVKFSVFGDARSLDGDTEIMALSKFIKRSMEYFGQNHAIQLSMSSDSGVRITSNEVDEARFHKKKQRKWAILLPLIILIKIAHLKMTLVSLILGVMALNILIVGGGGWLIHYLKFKTLCKIHPQLVQHHSHVYDSDPADYSQFLGSSFPGPYHGSSGSNPHETAGQYYSKDWSTGKAYQGYNFLDTISRRIQ